MVQVGRDQSGAREISREEGGWIVEGDSGRSGGIQGWFVRLADRLRRSGLGGFGFEDDRSQQLLPLWMVEEG